MAALAGCDALPRSGPSRGEILEGSVLRQGDAFIVPVDRRIARAAGVTPARGFGSAFRGAAPLPPEMIRTGDTLSLLVYENVAEGLLSGPSATASAVDEVQVDGAGMIFVPYAGRLRAAGNTTEELRRLITARLDAQTPDPQVVIRRLAGNGASVSVLGEANSQGVFPIERPTLRLSGMIAAAGGVAIPADTALVTISRGRHHGTAYFADIISNPSMDIAMRDGDTVLIERDGRSFNVLGATGQQSRVDFESSEVSAMDALGTVGGLNPLQANPTGLFVFRNEAENVARAVLGRPDLAGPQRIVYLLDLTEPNGVFEANDFVIRDGDTIYVTEAPVVRWNRAVASIFGSLGSINQATNTVTNAPI